MVKSPESAMGLPSRTASCAPGARNGGAGPKFTCSGVKAFCACDGCAANSTARERATARNGSFMELLQTVAHDSQFAWPHQTERWLATGSHFARVTSVPDLLGKMFVKITKISCICGKFP